MRIPSASLHETTGAFEAKKSSATFRTCAKRTMSEFKVWIKAGLILLNDGNTSFRMRLRLYAGSAFVLSSCQRIFLERAYARISSLVNPSRGRIREASLPGREELLLIPQAPFSPVPRKRLRINVSALSLALCATATAAYPPVEQRSANHEYRSSRAAISILIPPASE